MFYYGVSAIMRTKAKAKPNKHKLTCDIIQKTRHKPLLVVNGEMYKFSQQIKVKNTCKQFSIVL